MRVQTKYLDTFVAAFETGSFARAAEALHVTPSTVSYQMRQLEAWFGAPLFERGARRLLPTALGERLFAHVTGFIGELNALRQAVDERGTARPVLRIATGSSFGRYVLTPLLAQPAFEDTVIELRFGSDTEVVQAVGDGRADVGFGYTVAASNTLSFALVYRYALVLIAPAGLEVPGERADTAAIAQWLAHCAFVSYDDCESTFGRWFENTLGAMPQRLRSAARCSEIEEAIALVAAGRGLSVVPEYMLRTVGKEVVAVRFVTRPTTQDTVYRIARVGAQDEVRSAMLLRAIAALESG
ncbi:LysR family transcriptional regulator [Chitinasiproducens palmae]|uniref:DNA-binding transcriptional regulator, LysR family n=1 Tax=Chitinasiproducens palmae TaxID=1770053 RepID=A0A1H2PP08_9BURK|nr:LysR family transcriptional regulator [Chitinasiproducens palmae]SDV48461.1 DNA-binding transcriptional regulator, LysR family [Chitinasiproducens palmae]